MAARKLQTEIDRTLKKVSEGVELFESIYEKMASASNPTQKEKLEADLKTQIKKLQRMRDQIKTWVASNDIKDKSQLLDNRKLIETQMEKFKACEKEMKTKAFSKEGLIAAMRLDPKAQEKMETSALVSEWVEELGRQIEQAEAEIETLQAGGKKKKGNVASERLDQLDHLNERRRWHINRLEIILRLVDNGSLPPEKVNQLKDDIKYFVETNNEEDFDEDEGIYDELNLDEEEEAFGWVGDDNDSDSDAVSDNEDLPLRTPLKESSKKSSRDDESVSSSRKDEPPSPILKRQPPNVTLQLRTPKLPQTPNFAQQPMASILKHGLPPAPRPPATLPPIRYAAAAAAAVAPQTGPIQTASTPPAAVALTPSQLNHTADVVTSPSTTYTSNVDQASAPAPSPSLTHPSISGPSPMLSSASVSQQPPPSQGSRSTPPPDSLESPGNSPSSSHALSEVAPAATSSPQRRPSQAGQQDYHSSSEKKLTKILASVASPLAPSQAPYLQTNGSSAPPPGLSPAQTAPPPQPSPLPQQVQHLPSTQGSQSNGSSPLPPTANTQSVKASAQSQHPALGTDSRSTSVQPTQLLPDHVARPTSATGPQTTRNGPASFPGMSDLVVSFENAKQKAGARMSDLAQVSKILDSGYSNVPLPQDTEKPYYYAPRNPYTAPSYYPQTVMPVLSSAALFAKLDVETLFYVFYYLPGSYFQHLAAQELKRQSWRFHVKYLTWFQRHSEPQAITDEYEQGVYVYFDWEGSWCQRKKSDFRFEYRYLSED
ncbi:Not1 N-terminal domain, CCR4-Not complex component-domain-containing protein [Hysterangium stoloniferum]|nr:Not1 N-terminal domain, CCR4-Not complex component-domain-containing protein [Hysterangium stoloniferum]